MNAAVRLTDEVPGVIEELLPCLAQEKIICDDALRELQLTLRGLKIKLNVKFFEELGDGVRILILFQLHNLDDLPYCVPHARAHWRRPGCARRLRPAREHSGDGEVAQDPGCGGLDGVEVSGCEECFEEECAACWVVEIHKEGPMHEPSAGV